MNAPQVQELPKTHKALVQHVYAEPLTVDEVATPQPTPGSAILRMLASPVISYTREIHNGKLQYPYVTPMVPGTSAIGRVAAVGPDAALLKPGNLVVFDCTIRGRDDSSAVFLSGITDGSSEGGRKLMAGEWRDSSYAQYAKVPLENAILLDERRLTGDPNDGGLGYEIQRLAYIPKFLVPFGGLRDIRLEAGETVIIAPATGGFGGAAVRVAIAMGARVIAMGRNQKALESLRKLSDRVFTVPISGDVSEDTAALAKFGKIDAVLDLSPAVASKSSHLTAAIMSLRVGGRMSLMGGIRDNMPIPYALVMRKNIQLSGKWMYSRDDALLLLKMVDIGLLRLDDAAGVRVAGEYSFEQWKEAFDDAAALEGSGDITIFTP